MSNISDWPISNKSKNALKANGYLTIDDLRHLLLDDLKGLRGLGSKGVTEIREWCSNKYGVVFKARPKEKRKYLKNAKAAKQVVEHLVPETKDWGGQLRIADKLLEKYPLGLLLKVPRNSKIYSLAWYNSDYGDKEIRKYMEKVVVEKEVERSKEPLVFEEKSVFDIETTKPKTLRDFINL